MIGENWNAVMYDHMRTVGDAACMYFISLVVFGNIIMLNLFLAILLGNFDRARNFGEKKKIFDAFDNLSQMGYKLNIAIAYLFDDADLSKYIDEKILGKGYAEDSGSGEHKNELDETAAVPGEHSEIEILEVYHALCTGTIEILLQGERPLGELEDDLKAEIRTFGKSMSHAQKEKTLEILDYIKRKLSLKKQRMAFQL